MSGDANRAAATEPQIGHTVFFQLHDPAMAAGMVSACDKYLGGHPGTVYYSAGVLAPEFDRPVNDRDWDVALHLVFATRADHDRYQVAPIHQQFIDENKAGWKRVRVFDSHVRPK